ncbi:Methyltransferase domain [Enterobacter cloacae]|nr:Methyltransferase domain [Enterobacter cloacae]
MRRWLEENPDDDFAQEVRAELTICAIPLYFKLTVAVTDKKRSVTRLKRRIDDKERILHDAAPVDSLTSSHVVRSGWFLDKHLIK